MNRYHESPRGKAAIRLGIALALLAAAGCSGPRAMPHTDLPPAMQIAILEDSRTLDGGTLPRFLDDPDPAIRARCALALGRIQDPAAVPALLAALADTEAAVRAEALFALGQIPDAHSQAPLSRILANDPDPELRALAAEALGKLERSSLWPLLAERAGAEGDARVRREIALAFWRSGIPESSGDQAAGRAALLALIDDPDPEVRWRAVYSIGRSRYDHPDCVTAIRYVLTSPARHPEGWDRSFSARALGDIGGEDAFPLLLETLRATYEGRASQGTLLLWPLRVELLAAMAKLTPADATPTAGNIAMICSDETNTMARVQAIRLLGTLGMPGLGGLASGAWMEAEDFGQLAVGIPNLGLDDDEMQQMAGTIASEPSLLARMEAARGLSGHPADITLPILRYLFADEDRRVKTSAVEALGAFADDEHAHVIVRSALAVDDLAVRGAAVNVLKAWEDSAWTDDLLRAFRDSERFELTEVRAEAVEALSRLGDAVPVAFFREALQDPEPMVRACAAAAIEARTGEAIPFDRIHRTRPLSPKSLAPLDVEAPPRVRIATDRGEFVIELFHEAAPVHCRDFLERVEAGFYDGLLIHRVVPDFVVQGGDPRGDGWGGGDRFVREQIGRRRFLRGTVGMPTAGKDTGGVQIFITHCPTPHLDGRYTAFGRVIAGMDTVDRIERGDRILLARVVSIRSPGR